MLSILIPVYNQDVTKLVAALLTQCEQAGVETIISVYDDKSTRKWKKANEVLHHTFKVNYIELSENLGRAKIRNWLASAAPFENLLFLDGDSGIVRDDFITRYVQEIEAGYDVVYGGTFYTKKPCRSKLRRLHWKYGRDIEATSYKSRTKNPAHSFHSNNFLIKSDIISKIKFDESIVGYGYEDILLAEQIVKVGKTIKHIDNPAQHLGLEKTEDYLTKVEESVINLVKMQPAGTMGSTRLSSYYDKLSNYKLAWGIPWLYKRFENKITTKLYAEDPDLRALQLSKLYWYWKAKQGYL